MTTSSRDGVAGGAKKATESLSQFVARVLDQLSLSAWLPSAALVLFLAFLVHLGAILDSGQRIGPLAAIGQALAALAKVSFGGGLLLVAAVVVLTMLTQAFSFEAIRVLEGYWGTNRMVEWFAHRRCNRHRRVRARLRKRRKSLTEEAWRQAAAEIDRMQQDLVSRDRPVQFTPNMISALGAPVLGHRPTVTLTDDEAEIVHETDWRTFAPPEPLRRRLNIDKPLRDYPEAQRMQPTRLGNVLRHHEDKTGRETVESLVQEVFDELPASLRVEHDEQRTRLDLYCSMVFVSAVVGTVAIVRLGPHHWGYAIGAGFISLLCAAVMYRAAVASARAYGGLLLLIATHRPTTDVSASSSDR